VIGFLVRPVELVGGSGFFDEGYAPAEPQSHPGAVSHNSGVGGALQCLERL
jgi:hypothetical protein